MDVLTIGLRVVHIFTGVAWAGGAALFFFYIEPSINKLGPAAEPFVEEFVGRRKVPIYFLTASTLAVLGGLVLYWRASNGLSNSWTTSPAGLAFGLGGLAAVVAWIGGNLLIPRALARIQAIVGEMKAAGGPPSEELGSRLHAAQERLRTIGLVDLVLIGLALLGMAAGRYL